MYLLIVDNSQLIQPNIKQNFLGRQSDLGDHLNPLIANGLRIFGCCFLFNLFFVISHHPFQKYVNFYKFQQRITHINSAQNILLHQFTWHSFFLKLPLCKWIQTIF